MSATGAPAKPRERDTLRTNRGNLYVDADGAIDGLWRLVERELRSNAQVRAMCAHIERRAGRPSRRPVERHTLLRWRKLEAFPGPVVNLGGSEYWSRTEVETWIAARSTPQTV